MPAHFLIRANLVKLSLTHLKEDETDFLLESKEEIVELQQYQSTRVSHENGWPNSQPYCLPHIVLLGDYI